MTENVDNTDIPSDDPLADYRHLLDTHHGHLQAYSRLLEDYQDELDAVMVVGIFDEMTETYPSVDLGVDARSAALWMLGAHIQHVASVEGRHPREVCEEAVHYVREHTINPGDSP